MPINLLALCGAPGDSTVKRVRTSANVQVHLDGFFSTLEGVFRDGVETERRYESRWTPDASELATLPLTDEVSAILGRVGAGVLALDEISGSDFSSEQIRALAVIRGAGAGQSLVLQAFTATQNLSRRFALISSNNTFDRVEQEAFTLSNKVDVIVEGGSIKFKTFFNAKRVFDLSSYYKEATDHDVRLFASNPVLKVDAESLLAVSSQPIRKLISSVQSSGVLERESAASISDKARGLVAITVENDKIIVPLTRPELRDLMSFLDHKIYRSPVDEDSYETNSHRRRNA